LISHFNSLTDEEILEIEKLVNEKIWENIDVTTEIMNINDAVAKGAMAVFDEKYEDVVRVVSVPGFSMELCGGTHVKNTGNIGLFKILKESSPGAGVRRIEAVTLKGLLQRFNEQSQVLSQLTKSVNAPETVLVKKVEEIVSRSKAVEKEIERLKKSSVGSDIDSVIKAAQEVMGVKIISAKYDDLSIDDLRNLADSIRERAQSSAVFLASGSGGKVSLLYAATKKAVEKGIDCGKLIKETAPIVGGGGGGRPDMAQAGGKNVDAISKALEEAIKIAQSMIK